MAANDPMNQEIEPMTVNLILSTYVDPLYGDTTRLKVEKDVKKGEKIAFKDINDDTHGPKLKHDATNLQKVSTFIKDKLFETNEKNFEKGFNNSEHTISCSKGLLKKGQSDINTIICQLREKYENEKDTKKEELFNFISYLKDLKDNKKDPYWRNKTYIYMDNSNNTISRKVEDYYKVLLGRFVSPVSNDAQKETIAAQEDTIDDLLEKIREPLRKRKRDYTNDSWADEQLSGIKTAIDKMTTKNYAAYIYNLNQLNSLLKDNLYYNYTVFSKSKPMNKDEIYKFIVNTNNVASRNASAAVSATGTGLSTLGTGLSNMGKSALNMAKSATATQPDKTNQQQNTTPPDNTNQQQNTTPPKKGFLSSLWSFGKGGKSKKNKKSHSKKQKKSSRKQQKRRKSAKK